MSIPAIKDFSDYDQYSGETNATTDAEMQEYMDNQNLVLKALADSVLWQPSTSYAVGKIIHSPNMAAGLAAVCTTAGISSNVEQAWGNSGETITDGTVKWLMFETVRSVNGATPDINGNVSVPAMTGATSTTAGTEGLVPAPAAGTQNKALCGDGTFKGLEALAGITPIANGGTGATTAANARTNLGLSTAITAASISGRNITLTFADGTTKTLTTQDSTGYHTGNATSFGGASATKPAVVVTSYRSGMSWYRIWSDGWLEQGGTVTGTSITFHKAFADTNYNVVGSSSKASSSGAANSLSDKTTTGCTLTSFNNYGVNWYAFGKSA